MNNEILFKAKKIDKDEYVIGNFYYKRVSYLGCFAPVIQVKATKNFNLRSPIAFSEYLIDYNTLEAVHKGSIG